MKKLVAFFAFACFFSLLVMANEPAPEADVATLQNDLVSVTIEGAFYPYQDFEYNNGGTWVENIFYHYLSFHDGVETYSFTGIYLPKFATVEDWLVVGTDPNKVVTVTFADTDPATNWELAVTISMQGNGRKGVLNHFEITNLSKSKDLSNAKLYVWGPMELSGVKVNHVSAYNAGSGIFYLYNDTDDPNMWFGYHSDSSYPLHYYGVTCAQSNYPQSDYINGANEGSNFPDSIQIVNAYQSGGWNWDIGTVAGTAELNVSMAVGTSYSDLESELQSIVPVELMDFSAE